jgi:hypothetical protein
VRDPHVSVAALDFFRRFAYSNRWLRQLQHTERHELSLDDFIGALPGFRMVRFTDKVEGRCFPVEGGHLISLTWLPAWAFEVFKIAQFIELDCSHEATPPYAYCIPQAVVDNEAAPLGFTITPTERMETYEWFYTDLETMAGEPLPRKPILSDESDALTSFAGKRSLDHSFCYFHLVHKWRPYRILQLMASRALHIPDQKQFDLEIIEITAQLELLRTHRVVPEPVVLAFAHFLGYVDYANDPTERGPFRHGIWLRVDFGMPGANAHDERFHRTITGRLEGKDQQSLPPHLQVIVDTITEKLDQFLN